jgi:predicted PurR-regulated permease PerM
MTKAARLSYFFIFATLVLVAWLHLATPFITALFAYFALSKLDRFRHKALAVIIFVVVVLGIFYAFGWFIKHAIVAVPKIAATSVPLIIDWAKAHGFDLPFEDFDSLKALIVDTIKDQLKSVGNFARVATKEFVFLVIGVVVAMGLFLNPQMDLDRGNYRLRNNLYSALCDQIAARFRAFYGSFATVMGGQLIISLINTTLTAIFVSAVSLPYAPVVIGITLLAGLLPIVGNLISNAIIVGITFMKSPQMAIAALVFLIVLHKLEYFLNSKIIGERIKNPVWLTLLGLVLGERLMGIPGMILAPVVLNYLKIEASQIEVPEPATVGERQA